MVLPTDFPALNNTLLFQNLSEHELRRVSALLHRKTFPAGTIVFTVEQPGEVVWIIGSGTVKIHVEQASGEDVILALLGAGEIVGEMSLVDSAGRSATVSTQEDSTLFWIDRVAFQECLESIPMLTRNLVRVLARRVRLANEQIQALATLDVFGRVARQLLAFAQAYGEPAEGGICIPIRLTQSDLASLVGASRVRVNQVLNTYKQANFITIGQNHRITVLNQTALAQRCR